MCISKYDIFTCTSTFYSIFFSFHIYDVDSEYHNLPTKALKLRDQDFLGEASCVLSEVCCLLNKGKGNYILALCYSYHVVLVKLTHSDEILGIKL